VASQQERWSFLDIVQSPRNLSRAEAIKRVALCACMSADSRRVIPTGCPQSFIHAPTLICGVCLPATGVQKTEESNHDYLLGPLRDFIPHTRSFILPQGGRIAPNSATPNVAGWPYSTSIHCGSRPPAAVAVRHLRPLASSCFSSLVRHKAVLACQDALFTECPL
jgi:hypothetical protein